MKLSDELLAIRTRLVDGWDQWVTNSPKYGEQCLVLDRRHPWPATCSWPVRDILEEVMGCSAVEFNDDNPKEVTLAKLDDAIRLAKDRGL